MERNTNEQKNNPKELLDKKRRLTLKYKKGTRRQRRTREKKNALLGGLEPPAFRLTAERANQLRHKS